MAKVSLKSITPIKKVEPRVIKIGEHEVEVIQYLPLKDKLTLVESILNLSLDNTGHLNSMRLETYLILKVIQTYTNISITDTMLDNAANTYDLLALNGIIDAVIDAIPQEEYESVFCAVEENAENIVQYLNSFVGMMKTATADYQNTSVNLEKIMETLRSPEEVGLLKDIVEKIG